MHQGLFQAHLGEIMSEPMTSPFLDTDKTPCRGCGRPMIWGIQVNKDGTETRIPLDPSAGVYRTKGRDAKGNILVERDADAFVSHFKTCSKANDFSRSKKP